MLKRSWLALSCLIFAAGLVLAQNPGTPPKEQVKEQAPDVAGAWTGVWSSYNPAQGGSTPKDLCKNLSA